MKKTEKSKLAEHLAEEHSVSALSQNIKEILYGGLDGIVTTFAVVAGFAGAGSQIGSEIGITAVLLFGIANLIADGFSMGLGSFLSQRSEKDLYDANKQKEQHEIETNFKMEVLETEEILVEKGFSLSDAKKMTELYTRNKPFWVSFMMTYELQMSDHDDTNPYLNGLITFLSFIFFGSVPLLPYFFGINSFVLSIWTTSAALLMLSGIRYYVTKTKPIRSFFETFLIGLSAAALAYFVGTFFKA